MVSSSAGGGAGLRPARPSGAGGNGSTARRFVYDGDRLVEERDDAGNLLRRYAHASGVDEPFAWYEGAGIDASARRTLLADQQGSILVVRNASNDALAINSYDEYGITRNTANSAVSPYGTFGYTGQAWLPELGMHYYKARIYSPTLGRFLQVDPIGYGDGMNWYNYVGSDPVNKADPSGTCTAPADRVAGCISRPNGTEFEGGGDLQVVLSIVASASTAGDGPLTGLGFLQFALPGTVLRDGIFNLSLLDTSIIPSSGHPAPFRKLSSSEERIMSALVASEKFTDISDAAWSLSSEGEHGLLITKYHNRLLAYRIYKCENTTGIGQNFALSVKLQRPFAYFHTHPCSSLASSNRNRYNNPSDNDARLGRITNSIIIIRNQFGTIFGR